MNTIGVSCPGFTKVPFEEMHHLIAREFTHWEIFSELNHYGPLVAENYFELIHDSKLTFSLHTGIGDINVASSNELIRNASISNILAEMKAANKLGIDTVTIHPGLVNMAVKDTRSISLERVKKSMKVFDKASKEFGISACIENMPNLPIMLGIEAKELAEIIDGTDLSVCFDIGHANTFGQIEQMVDVFGDRICNIHIHDNQGKTDDHMTLGEGSIDFPAVLSLLKKYSRRYIIESRSLESAVVSKAYMEHLLGH